MRGEVRGIVHLLGYTEVIYVVTWAWGLHEMAKCAVYTSSYTSTQLRSRI